VGGDDALSGVLDLEIGPDGRIYVTQQFVSSVTVFTREGEPDGRIGRAGSGPGEFDGWPVRLGWLADTLWVADHWFVHYLAPDGTEIRRVEFTTPIASEASVFRAGAPLGDGTFLGNRTLRGPGMTAFFGADQVPLRRFSATGEILDTIALVAKAPSVDPEGLGSADHPLTAWIEAAWLPVTVTPDRSAVMLIGEVRDEQRPATFELLELAITGDTLLAKTLPYEPQPVTDDERKWLTDGFASYIAGDYMDSEGFPMSDAQRERRRSEAREAITFPEHHPPVRRIVAGQDGTIWLLRELALPDLVDRWEAYSANGDLLGTVLIDDGRSSRVPWEPRLNVLRATRDEIWATTLDELDVPYIHRYRVVSSCR
jgi:hypothetical protein